VGSGFKTFTAGSVLTASDVQNYLQDQAVMVFGGTAARSSAIGTANFEEGMLTYLTDVDKLQVYTGSSFQDVYPPAATSQGMTLINTTSFSAVASQSTNSVFSSTYTNYKIILQFSAFSTDMVLRFRMRASGTDATGANYTGAGAYNYRDGLSVPPLNFTNQTYWEVAGTMLQADVAKNYFTFEVANPFAALPTVIQAEQAIADTSGSNFRWTTQHVNHNVSTSYDGFTIFAFSGNFTGTVSVYGYNK
jgi:hypothetical protein